MLLSYKIEHANQNEIRVIVLNHNRPSLDTCKEVDSFHIYYQHDEQNNCFVQGLSPFAFKFYTSDKEFMLTLNREVNLFAPKTNGAL